MAKENKGKEDAGKEKKGLGGRLFKKKPKEAAAKEKGKKEKLKAKKAKGKEEKEVKKIEVPKVELSAEEKLRNYEIILYPLITEKAVGMIESQNTLSFVVGNNATKKDVKKAIEGTYAVKVDGVRILNDKKGRKKAFVKINEQFKADDIATKLGVI